MLQRPRKTKYSKFFNYSKTNYIKFLPMHSLRLVVTRTTKIKWLHFETLRIKLARIFAKQRRGGKKTFFKQKMQKKQTIAQKSMPIQKLVKKSNIKIIGIPSLPQHTKTQGSRMGKGKGGGLKWYYYARKGTPLILFNIKNRYLLYNIRRKLPRLFPCIIQIDSESLI